MMMTLVATGGVMAILVSLIVALGMIEQRLAPGDRRLELATRLPTARRPPVAPMPHSLTGVALGGCCRSLPVAGRSAADQSVEQRTLTRRVATVTAASRPRRGPTPRLGPANCLKKE